MNRTGALASIVLLCAAGGARAEDWPPPGLSCPPHLVVLFKNGPAADKGRRLYAAHIAFVTAHLESGEILTMGPSESGGGLAVFRNPDWRAAQQTLADEPFTKNRVLKITRHFTWTGCALK
ncbi:MAG: hypothetical protein JWR80_7475 [Bradyrhizobium sp.]|nr:hypothetical protein [Bradyrhizobium sp.]